MALPENLKTNPVTKYLAESRSELEKVTWPSKQTVINHTILVIVLSLALAIFIGVIDYVLSLGVQELLK